MPPPRTWRPGADPALGGEDDLAAGGDGLDGVEDLDVPGAAAKMGAEMAGHVLARQGRALAVDLRFGPHDDPGDAETALEPAGGREGLGVAPALGFLDAFERGHAAAFDLGQRGLARHLRLAVEQDRATAALAARRAAVLGRGHVELLAQCGQQVRVVGADRGRGPVEGEGDGRGLHYCHRLTPLCAVMSVYVSGRRYLSKSNTVFV